MPFEIRSRIADVMRTTAQAWHLTHPRIGSLRVAEYPLQGATPAVWQSQFRGVSRLGRADACGARRVLMAI